MTRLGMTNGAALTLALGASLALVLLPRADGAMPSSDLKPTGRAGSLRSLPDGRPGIEDASGHLIALGRYTRIASASSVADAVLWELCEPNRVVAYTRRSQDNPRTGHRYRGKPGIVALTELETLLSLKPDLLLLNHYTNDKYIARLRERGIVVFDLGQMRGLSTLLPNIVAIAELIGHGERGRAMARRLEDRMARIAQGVAGDHRPRALYLSRYGNKLYGGTRGTGFHDVLIAAGLQDAAADHYEGWPEFDSEQVLAIDPDIIVTFDGMAASLCRYPGLQRLRVCGGGGRLIELDPHLLEEPGPTMLEAAEALHELVYAPARSGAIIEAKRDGSATE